MERRTFTNLFVFFLLLLFPLGFASAQATKVSGRVTDDKNEPVSFATVVVEGTTHGANTDLDGKFDIPLDKPGSYVLIVTFVGYTTVKQPFEATASGVVVNVQMKSDALKLNEVVVIGYGTLERKDLTGSVASVNSKDFNKGVAGSPEQLVVGKIAGLQIVMPTGAPGSGSQIRIRGTSSLNASNDPLIVIDGVPIESGTLAWSANPLNMINPNDIETFTVLKDASATAIYGSRASNGVIIITTKKGVGSKKLKIEVSTTNSVAQVTKSVDLLSAEEFRQAIQDYAAEHPGKATAKQLMLLDTAFSANKKKYAVGSNSTDWQDEIYRIGLLTDNNISFSGGIKKLPYRLTFNYFTQTGTLDETKMDRYGVSFNLSPSLLKDHIKVDFNSKFTTTHNNFSNDGAIGGAINFDPTKPIYTDTSAYGGYFEWLEPSSGLPNANAPRNPVGLLKQKDNQGRALRYIGNIGIDYKFHFLPDLHANLNVGVDYQHGRGVDKIPDYAASNFTKVDSTRGSYKSSEAEKMDKLLEFYLNYIKEVKKLKSKFDVTAGYSYQDWFFLEPNRYSYYTMDGFVPDDTIKGSRPIFPTKNQNTLISFYGRLNYTLLNRYLLTATLRDDGSSRFGPDTRWGIFPSAAVAWRISDEAFLKKVKILSNLKVRLGYGVTGQQEGIAKYSYLAIYNQGQNTAQYQFGDAFYYALRPDGYDANIKWETTDTYNGGVDFGFWNGRVNGSVDIYHKYTKDLLSEIPLPAGSNFTNKILTNVGSMENKGVEIMLNVIPIDKKNLYWEVSVNATRNTNKLTQLDKVEDPENPGIMVTGINGGVGNTIQIHSVGYPLNTFYLYKQLYDANGKPIEAGTKKPEGSFTGADSLYKDIEAYQDMNGDSTINPDDLYRSKSPNPDWYFGFSTRLTYKDWTLGFSLRSNIGSYVYNNVNSSLGAYNVGVSDAANKNYLSNLASDYLNTHFQKPQYLSDYYLENASFLKMDNISLGYNFTRLLDKKLNLTATFIVQNVFTITKYTGIDPEIANGVGYSLYPRARVYSINLSVKL